VRRGEDSTAPASNQAGIAVFLGVLLLLLLPFVTRAFHIDDPLFLWTADHIRSEPANPYNFAVNWYWFERPMSLVMENPPLASYYLALVRAVFGPGELAAHLAFVGVALAAAYGVYLLARRLCEHALLAVALATLTPVFFVSSLTVMSDVLMLALWVFAVHLWLVGLDRQSHLALGAAAVLVALAALAKYFGIALLPLLLVYSAVRMKRPGWWLAYLAIPAIAMGLYELAGRHLYGHGLIFNAAKYAVGTKVGFGRFTLSKVGVDLAFLGACVASAVFFAHRLWSRRQLIAGGAIVAAVVFLLGTSTHLGPFEMPTEPGAHWLLAAQFAFWLAAGVGLIALALIDLNQRRDADSLLLFLWLNGTFVFAGFVNWTMNGRTILPIVVPAGILIVRRLENRRASVSKSARTALRIVSPSLVAAAALAVAVAWADSTFANVARDGALQITKEFTGVRRLWFQGHWGFQYYMEQRGPNAKAMDVNRWSLAASDSGDPWALVPGDVIAIPAMNTNFYGIPTEWYTPRRFLLLPSSRWIGTMNRQVGAGFYSDEFGPLPFAFGSMEPERFVLLDVKK